MCNLSMSRLDNQIERFWHIEKDLNQQRTLSAEETLFQEHFKKNVRKGDNGRFVMRIPMREQPSALGTSFNPALKRLESLERRFKRDPQLKAAYFSVMKKYQEMSVVNEDSFKDQKVRYYIPHHAVVKLDSTKNQVPHRLWRYSRVNFWQVAQQSTASETNHSRKSSFSRPAFRLHQYVITTDIEKMYRQVWVNAADWNLQCILWREQPTDPVTIFQLKTVTFGTAAAPFLATRCLKEASNIV